MKVRIPFPLGMGVCQMQKLSLKEDEKIFKAGFDKALEKIHFVNRFEVIYHTKTEEK